MPIKTSNGKWKWGNVVRDTKKELAQTVYGIWKKNGSKGSFSSFWHGKHANESWNKKRTEFFCDQCGKNLVEAPEDQYVMIDDKLWDYVCKHGKPKLKLADILCRDCIEDRLGRKLTIKDLGKYKNTPINDELKKLLKKKPMSESEDRLFFVGDLDYKKHIVPVLKTIKSWKNVDIENVTKYSSQQKLKWFGLYSDNSIGDIRALATVQLNFEDYTVLLENICSNGGGSGKQLIEDLIEYYSKNTDRKYMSWFVDPTASPSLLEYYKKSFPDAKVEDYNCEYWKTKKFTVALKKMNESSNNAKWFKIKDNGVEIGKYGLSFYDDIKAVGIGDLEIYPEYRNRGYGTRAIQDIVDKYKKDYDLIYCFVDANNTNAIRLYRHIGKVNNKKNKNGQYYVEFYKKMNESSNGKVYAYHCTNVDPEKIKKEGWKVGKGYTERNRFGDLYKKYLPNIPVFVSNEDVPVWDRNAKYCMKLDITGLDLYPDFGRLPDTGAYYDEEDELFYWEDFLDNKMKKYISQFSDEILYAKDFTGEDSFRVLGTACVDGSKLKDRIVTYYKNKNISESYERPWDMETIRKKYGDEVYSKLKDDPVHKFRAETGIEVIHKEPTQNEFERIAKNWDLMDDEMKRKSDEFSMKQFGKNNKDRIEEIKAQYSLKEKLKMLFPTSKFPTEQELREKEKQLHVGDRVKIADNIRCFEKGQIGTIVKTPDGCPEYTDAGWKNFYVKCDNPKFGISSFQSGYINKI